MNQRPPCSGPVAQWEHTKVHFPFGRQPFMLSLRRPTHPPPKLVTLWTPSCVWRRSTLVDKPLYFSLSRRVLHCALLTKGNCNVPIDNCNVILWFGVQSISIMPLSKGKVGKFSYFLNIDYSFSFLSRTWIMVQTLAFNTSKWVCRYLDSTKTIINYTIRICIRVIIT